MSGRLVTVNSRKFDGAIRRSWKCRLLEQQDDRLMLVGRFDIDVEHPDLGLIRRGTISYEYYWLNRWFNIFRFHEPDGTLRNYYCNVNLPPTLRGDVLDYVDLDIDVLVWPNGKYKVLDIEEFEAHARMFGYSDQTRNEAMAALGDIISLIEGGALP